MIKRQGHGWELRREGERDLGLAVGEGQEGRVERMMVGNKKENCGSVCVYRRWEGVMSEGEGGLGREDTKTLERKGETN